ncbi:Holliday junction branch migration protein RuvA [Lachnospiraceae bacterium NSJ-143]|nr:Holliday junction branch migration protein RuvA [Lachnospiraceae bacterium NSJ-143]
MISYIKGILEDISDTGVVVEAGGIGYFISMPPSISVKFRHHSEVKIYTYMNVKEDGISLFGFESQKQLELFKRLTAVSGIGGKTAMALLGTASVNEITSAIVSNDISMLCRAPGLGKKGAQRIVLELKDKISNDEISAVIAGDINENPDLSDSRAEALEAMLVLGYGRSEAVKALSDIYEPGDDTSALIKKALKKISEK